MQEPCLICQGSGRQGEAACGYCAGSGRIKVRTQAPETVLLATGSCKMPVRKVTLQGGLTVSRKNSLPPMESA
jgi:DnaJ-class molecular chaperone